MNENTSHIEHFKAGEAPGEGEQPISSKKRKSPRTCSVLWCNRDATHSSQIRAPPVGTKARAEFVRSFRRDDAWSKWALSSDFRCCSEHVVRDQDGNKILLNFYDDPLFPKEPGSSARNPHVHNEIVDRLIAVSPSQRDARAPPTFRKPPPKPSPKQPRDYRSIENPEILRKM